ncbi:hypothetical protein [Clostridium beijerinckii]|uniref:Uncharacterized protein n=1 Tax=Clostridium beijerinckii TaxID=1520 RepID=A0AAX0B8J8_CLOBE|nr:hypothetical protein [Clostridium beijerinckii]NRT91272.1 hypothetical protein [Clostridium beijerinckii]NYC70798.1 hypothetical protein [Clostridium beijerinckii]
MDFSIGNLVNAVVGAVAKVANAVIGIASAIGSALSNPEEAIKGAMSDIANITADGKIDEDEEEELFEDILKLYVGASILKIKNEYNDISSILSDTITNFNNEITILNKSAVLIANTAAAEASTYSERLSNLWNDFFMPTDLPGELNAAKLIDNPLLKGVADVGGKLGLVGTVANPILEYNNSLEPYKDDIDAAYEIDPQNALKYNYAMHAAAGADAASFGYARGVINTIPSLYELAEGKKDWSEKWINNVNYWVNSRNLMNEADKAFKDPVKGPIIKQFLR